MTAATFNFGPVETRTNDLNLETAERFRCTRLLACDIETSGLEWSTDRIATIQLFSPGESPVIVRVNGKAPKHVASLLQDDRVEKIFHHAMFDLRFIAHHWGVHATNVRCTKIAAKLLYPNDRARQSLTALISEHLGLVLDKSEQTSDWSARKLSRSQLEYAANDVIHLPHLYESLRGELLKRGLWHLASECFDHVPTRVRLDIGGFGDPFTY